MNKIRKEVFSIISLLLVTPSLVGAQLAPNRSVDEVVDIWDKACTLADWFYTAALIFSIFAILYAAFLYVTSGGNEESATKANQVMLYAVVGVVVALLAYGVPNIINSLVGGTLTAAIC